MISPASGIAIRAINAGSKLTIAGMKIQSNSMGIVAENGGAIIHGSGIVFGTCTNYHMRVNGMGAVIQASSISYSVVGGAQRHLAATPLGYINLFGSTCTITGTLASTIFAYADRLGLVSCNGSTFDISGATVTGKRYDVSSNGLIFTSCGGASYFPGSTTGTAATGGQYT